MNRISKLINTVMNLREPQLESLKIFEDICDSISFEKTIDLSHAKEVITAKYPTLSDFERNFPSFTFALATGIGKTRLMGAFISYLHLMNISHNFFVIAPNLTIYNKLITEFTNISDKKYIFKGLDFRINVITGDDYEEFRETGNVQLDLGNEFNVYLFNISKINTEIRANGKQIARFRRLNEELGKSFFDYLVDLPDLVILMDESHHYHADSGFYAINELNPILGVEFTATPIITKKGRSIPFKNVVYEYSLAQALDDQKYIKIPTVFTRSNLNLTNLTTDELDRLKLKDGVSVHLRTKSELDIYSRQFSKPYVKPFMLVIAKDTNHSQKLMSYMTSDEFFDGEFKNKIIEINSSQTGSEKDENIQKLLSLEDEKNLIEIVLHVNMLKEGWDVKNLFTIVPLRASASDTLTEQTLGRGLRLPYGERTNVDSVDTLSIISHDRYQEIVDLANQKSSLLRKLRIIEIDEDDRKLETVELRTSFEANVANNQKIDQFALAIDINLPNDDKNLIAKNMVSYASKLVEELGKHSRSFSDIENEENRKLVVNTLVTKIENTYKDVDFVDDNLFSVAEQIVEYCTQTLTQTYIPIPEAIIQPNLSKKKIFKSFKLDTIRMNWQPIDQEILGMQLDKEGKIVRFEVKGQEENLLDLYKKIVKLLVVHENVDYEENANLIYSLINDLYIHLKSYLSTEEKIIQVISQNLKSISDIIYAQMMENIFDDEIVYSVAHMRPFKRLESGFGSKVVGESIKTLKDSVSAKNLGVTIFSDFTKACHTMYKFDSIPELNFARICEVDNEILKWLRPSKNQFHIYYDRKNSYMYEPDFVVETLTAIYLVEVKSSNTIENNSVFMKAKAAIEYCKAATEFNKETGGKPWQYHLIRDTIIKPQNSLSFLLNNSEVFNHQELDLGI